MKNQANTLKINSTDGYLHLEDLPHNCIFNKVITGCGGTTIAITNSENYVIAVPTKELIVNIRKQKQVYQIQTRTCSVYLANLPTA